MRTATVTCYIVVVYVKFTSQIYAYYAYLYVLLIWRLISPWAAIFFTLTFSDSACNHCNRHYFVEKRTQTAGPADRFQIFIALTIRAL
jgi:hypothetical protein